MADQNASAQVLSWGRDVTGRFIITVALPVQIAEGQSLTVPIHTFALTKEEEHALRASLGGLAVASTIPELITH